MKIIATIFGILIVSFAYGQDTLLFGVTTPKGINGQITDPRIIVYSGKLDFDFYNKYFNVPYNFPGLLIDYKHTNDTLIVWSDSTRVGDVKSNWSYTIIYDSNSRVKSYRYSSCEACSQLPYEYHFLYNQQGQLISMNNGLNDDARIEFLYDVDGNIVNVKVFHISKLKREIELIKK